jgi:hypothetical protein
MAGGFQAREAFVNGQGQLTVQPEEPFRFCVIGDLYLYSGNPNEDAYLPVLIKHGDLPPRDIQQWFFTSKASMYLIPISKGGRPVFSPQISNSILIPNDSEQRLCSYFTAPSVDGRYYFEYDPLPLFTRSKLGRMVTPDTILVEEPLRHREIEQHLEPGRLSLLQGVEIIVQKQSGDSEMPPEIYLKINGKFQSSEKLVHSGFYPAPLEFSWFSRKADHYYVQYSYRLFFMDNGWSQWSSVKEAVYSFVYPGVHTFRVRTRYRSSDTASWREAGEVTYSFSLDAPFVSGAVSKGFGTPESAPPILTELGQYYTTNSALVLHISDFENSSFEDLPYTQLDALQLTAALTRSGFNVNRPISGSYTSAELMNAISTYLRGLEVKERSILYISTHGFQDKFSGKPYLATSECDPQKPDSTCLALSAIEPILAAASEKAKHILVIIDACSAGLGTLGKATFMERAVLDQPGVHIMTAGLANQVAQIDRSSGLSVFTKELIDSFGARSDVNDDGVITLVELFRDIRASVAKLTQGQQVPSIGRLSGFGEIMFAPTGNSK